ncbi:MAG: radical SAM protein [Oscillochloris sp.]|nr:radical SAM protein [Oscillochloris sp.]
MPLRGDRIVRYVSAFCPHCYHENPERPLEQVRRLAGHLSADGAGRVWLVRGCPEHGLVRTLYDESAEILSYLEQWTAPTRQHTPDRPGNFDPLPQAYLRGLDEMHTQHTCTLLEDIEQGCNLCCPNCFTDSSPQRRGPAPVETILANVDTRIAREGGRIDVLMLSGGEPTIHPQLIPLLDALVERPIVRILINTNGIEIAQNDELLNYLKQQRKRMEVYLQFDGFKLETQRYHRGSDLRKIKEQAITRLSAAGVFTTLTMTATLGVNDDEIGAVLLYALETPFVGGVSIQPQFGSGRSTLIDPGERLTHTGTLARFGPQTDGLVSWRDMIALPCSHPHCCSVGYMLLTDKGEWRSLAAIIGHENLQANLGLVSNRIVDPELSAQLRQLVKESLIGLFSEQTSLTSPQVGALFRNVCESCDIGMSTLLRLAGDAMLGRQDQLRELLARRVKRITIKPFMDMHTMIEERLTQCCVHVGTQGQDEAHQCAPFCAVQAWPALGRQRLSAKTGA